MSYAKCCRCGRPNPDGPVFRAEHDPFNKYARFRRAVRWCQTCWDEHKARCQQERDEERRKHEYARKLRKEDPEKFYRELERDPDQFGL